MLGEDVHVEPSAVIEDGVAIGARTAIWHFAQVRSGVQVGADCVVGSNAHVGIGCTLGDRVKVGNHADIFGATIEDGAFIGPHALVMEDSRPRAVTPDGSPVRAGQWTPHPVTICEGATVGGGARVLPGVVIGRWSMVGAGAVVHRDVPAFALVAGSPARAVGWVCRCGETLPAELLCPSCDRKYLDDGNQLSEA